MYPQQSTGSSHKPGHQEAPTHTRKTSATCIQPRIGYPGAIVPCPGTQLPKFGLLIQVNLVFVLHFSAEIGRITVHHLIYFHTSGKTMTRSIVAGSLTAIILVLGSCSYNPDGEVLEQMNSAKAVQEITDLLMTQEADWNRGDTEAFMAGYWRSDSLRFVSSGSVNYGWQVTLDNYHRRYPTPESMGSLTFSELDIRPLTKDWATVFGRFTLVRSEEGGGDITGLFTLVLRRLNTGWVVIQDHTSTL